MVAATADSHGKTYKATDSTNGRLPCVTFKKNEGGGGLNRTMLNAPVKEAESLSASGQSRRSVTLPRRSAYGAPQPSMIKANPVPATNEVVRCHSSQALARPFSNRRELAFSMALNLGWAAIAIDDPVYLETLE